MITISEKTRESKTTEIVDERISKNPFIGTINLTPVWHGIQYDIQSEARWWLWFPLTMESEVFGKTFAADWIKVYPRIIQWTDGKYYAFRGTHSAIPEYRIKGDNTVYYREILVEKGEKLDYY
jgi:hypothetical protein